MSNTAAAVIATAAAELGYREGQNPDGTWNNQEKYVNDMPDLAWAQGQPWCAIFVCWVAQKNGLQSEFPRTASCGEGVSWWKNASRFSEYPAIGAQVFFGPGGGEHTGIVESYDDSTVTVISGNDNDGNAPSGIGNAVTRSTHQRRDSYVYGYGYPAYDGGIVSDDPAWNKPVDQVQSTSTDASQYVPFPGSEFFYDGQHSDIITKMGERLVAEGCSHYQIGPNPDWSGSDRNSYAAWQRKYSNDNNLNWTDADCDGIPGQASWDALKVPQP